MEERDLAGTISLRSSFDRSAREAATRARVLCLTGDPSIRETLDDLARSNDLHVIHAKHVLDAMQAARHEEFTVLAVDVELLDTIDAGRLRERLPSATHVALAAGVYVELPSEPEAVSGVVRIGHGVEPEAAVDALGRAQLLYEARKASASGLHPTSLPALITEVLLLEDSLDDADMIEAYLRRAGVEHVTVTRAERLDHSLLLLEQRSFALIMTDLSLPDARGVDAVVALRRFAPNTPIVVLSGVADEATALQAMEHGAQEYLLKSELSSEVLRRTLRHAVGRKVLEDRLQYQAHHDELTGLANRALFRDRLEHALAKAKRSGERLAVLFIDLDRFKQVNDTFGHEAGDALLRVISERLGACVRASDTLARLGGDEFAVLTESLASPAAALQVAERIVDALREPFGIGGREPIEIAGSVGIAFFPDDGQSVDILLKRADIAMYRAKRRNGSRYVCFSEQGETRRESAQALEERILRALRARKLEIARHAVMLNGSNEPFAFCFLPTWRTRDPVPASARLDRLLAAAGVADDVCRFVLAAACKAGCHGLSAPALVRVSAGLFQSPRFSEEIAEHLESHRVPQRNVCLLVGQAEVGAAPERANAELERLRRMGVETWLADFGAAGADLDVLRQVPALSGLVFDTAWAEELVTSPQAELYVRAVSEVARAAGMWVIAPPLTFGADLFARAGCHGVIQLENAAVPAA